MFAVRFIWGAPQSFFKKNDASFVRSVEEKKYFAMRHGENARQTRSLSCV
jgi:hypothetical protein